jgi:NitT/TauT family transport system substrate-binding protein
MKSSHLPRRTLAVITLVVVALGGVVLLKPGREDPRPREPITVAVARQPLSAPVYVAQEQGLFEQEGLEVTLQTYEAGKDALEAVLNGQHLFCTVAETPVMFAALHGEPLALLATLAEAKNYVKIVARKDRGIAGPPDLRGKTIGVRAQTSSEYFLYAYLIFNRIAPEDVQRVDVKLEAMAEALAEGQLDAVVSWEPYLTAQQQRLGDKALVLTNEYILSLQWNIVTRQEFANGHPDTVQRFLRALIKASDYLNTHPQEARAIVARYLGEDSVTLSDYTFGVHLRQNLLLNLESQARWAIQNRLSDQPEVPDFLPFLHLEGLRSVNPDAVTVIQ